MNSESTDPSAPTPELDDDALSGRLFLRWNLAVFILALLALAVGVWLSRS